MTGIIDAERQFRGLGHLQDLQSGTGRIDRTRGNQIGLPRFRVHRMQDIVHLPGQAAAIKILCFHLAGKAQIQGGIRIGRQDIPEGRFSEGIVPLTGDIVRDIHPQGRAGFHIHRLDRYRELRPEILEGILPHQPVQIGFHKLAERVRGQPAVVHEGVGKSQVCQMITGARFRIILGNQAQRI